MNADKIKDFHHKLREATGILALNISYADDNYKTSDVGIALKRLQDVLKA